MMPPHARARPIVVTGCPRSGTTWVGKIICASGKAFYVHEPFNPACLHNLGMPERFIALTDENAAPHRAELDALVRLGRFSYRVPYAARALLEFRRSRYDQMARLAAIALVRRRAEFLGATRVCIKDPLAFYAAEWLARTYDAQVVMLVRHPLGVISSYISLGWESELAAIAERALSRRARYLAPELDSYRRRSPSLLKDLILQWKILTEATLDLKQRHPDWLVIVHDRLCLAPERHFRALFDWLSLPFDNKVARRVNADTSAANVVDPVQPRQHLHQRNSRKLVDAWRTRLESDAVDCIMRETGSLWDEVMQST